MFNFFKRKKKKEETKIDNFNENVEKSTNKDLADNKTGDDKTNSEFNKFNEFNDNNDNNDNNEIIENLEEKVQEVKEELKSEFNEKVEKVEETIENVKESDDTSKIKSGRFIDLSKSDNQVENTEKKNSKNWR